jgi:hypothetical protein
MDDEHDHLQHFRHLGEFKQEIRERASELIGEGIEPTVVARTVLVASIAITEEYLDSTFHLFKWMHEELGGIEHKYFPGGEPLNK